MLGFATDWLPPQTKKRSSFLRLASGDESIGACSFSCAYLAFSAVLRCWPGAGASEFAKDVELLVLGHQLAVLGRQDR